MKVLSNDGLTKLIQLSKDEFIPKSNTTQTSTIALAAVATSGSYTDLSNKPTIATLTTTDQLAAINSGATTTNIAQITTNANNISTINGKIPSAASSSNQLADKAFVNSSINAIAAYYITSDVEGDAFATKAALDAGPYYHDGSTRTPTENDYAIVAADETHNNACTRYSYTGSQWSFQYVVNDTPFTQAQIDAINSGITSTKVGNYNTHIADTTIHVTSTDKTNWNNKVDKVSTASKLYGTNSSGAQTTYTLTSTATANTVAYRTADGVLSVGTPTSDAHAATKKYVDDGLTTKQDALVSGTNIKTINSQSILGSGDLAVDGLPSQSGQSGKFLTTNGTAASWTIVGDSGDIIPYGTSSSAAADTEKTVTISSITSLKTGQLILVQPSVTSTVANSTLKLNNFTAYPMKYGTAAITTSSDSVVWNASWPTLWRFDGSNWQFITHGVDTNTTYTSMAAVSDAGSYTSGSGSYAISRYSIIAEKPDGTWEKITATNKTYTTGTTKTVNTNGFILNQLKYYSTTTNLANGAKSAVNVVFDSAASVDLRYSTNCGTVTTGGAWNEGAYIYLVGTINSTDGLFYFDTTNWWTSTLPSTNDGKLYIQIGHALKTTSESVDYFYTMAFYADRPIFYHDGTRLREYKVADNKQDLLVSGTNIKTINNNSLLGSGNLTIDSLPSQSGQSGKYLTTNGTSASWVSLTIPTTTDSVTSGSTAALTSGGAYTNLVTKVEAGTTANKINVTKAGSTSTITVNNVASATTASKLGSSDVGNNTTPIYLAAGTPTALSYTIAKSVPSDAKFTDHEYTNGAGISLSSSTFSANCDTTTVSTNSNSKLQAIGVIDKKTSNAVYTWKGTKSEYDALSTYNNNWIYYITDEGIPSSADYYTKAQIDAMRISNRTIQQSTATLLIKDTNAKADVTTAPASAYNGGLVKFIDKNGVDSGYLYTRYETNGDNLQILQSNKTVNGTAKYNYIGVGIKADGTNFTYAPTPAASTSTTDTNIATVGWINNPNRSTAIVHTAGTETITGAKTFSGNNTFSGTDIFSGNVQFTANPEFVASSSVDPFTITNTSDDYTTAPSSTTSTNIIINDANGEYTGGWEHYHQADGTCINQIKVRRQNGNDYGVLQVAIDTEGNTSCNLPTDTYGTNFHGVSTRALWADLAENYRSDEKYSVGTLIKFGGEKDITLATNNEVHGVISDKPGYLLDADLENGQPVALVGKTPIRIIGSVKKFDKITLSEISGVGRVAKEGEKVIGRALETVIDQNEKLVMCVTKFSLD